MYNQAYAPAHATPVRKVKSLNLTSFWNTLERDRFGLTPLFLVVPACLGGFAAAVAVQYSILMLAIVGLFTGLVEVLLISIIPMRITFWFMMAAIALDIFVFLS